MNQVPNISRLRTFVRDFTGKTVDEAIKAAEEWSERTGVVLAGNYYLRTRIGKSESIIVDLEPIKDS
jgi:hypothetical protein